MRTLNLNIDMASLMDLYSSQFELGGILQGYQRDGIDVPEDIVNKLDQVTTEIQKRNRDNYLRELRLEESKIEGYLSKDEKRTRSEKKIADLKAKLGIKPVDNPQKPDPV